MSWGLLFIFANLLYLGFSIIIGAIVGYLIYRFTNKKSFQSKTLSILIFLTVLLFPFYDLIIQKGIKTYYEIYKMDGKIYAYPEKNDAGKVQSLGISKEIYKTTLSHFLTDKDFENFKKITLVESFFEVYIVGNFGKNIIEPSVDFKDNIGYAKIDLNQNKFTYKTENSPSEFKSRYQILAYIDDTNYFTRKINIEFWDKKNNSIIAKGFELQFVNRDKERFRSKYLLWKGANGVDFGIIRIRNYHVIFERLFGFPISNSKN